MSNNLGSRVFNLQKFDACSGQLIWTREIKPPYAGVSPAGPLRPDPNITSADAVEIEPIHGTNDVIVRLDVSHEIANHQHNLARITSCGCVDWFRSIATDFPTATYNPPVSMAALSDGNTLVSESGPPVAFPGAANVRFLQVAPDGSGSQFSPANPSDSNSYGFRLWELPTTANAIALGWHRLIGGYFFRLQRRSQTAIVWDRWFRRVIDSAHPQNYDTLNPLAVSPTKILCYEEWFSHFTAAGNSDRDDQLGGLVLRSTSGASYSVPFNPPPQSDVLVNTTQPTQPTDHAVPAATLTSPDEVIGASIEFREGYFAAMHGDAIYVQGARVTRYWRSVKGSTIFGYEYVSAIITERTYFLWRLDSNLGVVWEIATDNNYGGLRADEHGVVCVHRVDAGSRVYWLERRDPNGTLKWSQSIDGLSVTPYPPDLCLTDAGSLFVCTRQLNYFR